MENNQAAKARMQKCHKIWWKEICWEEVVQEVKILHLLEFDEGIIYFLFFVCISLFYLLYYFQLQ